MKYQLSRVIRWAIIAILTVLFGISLNVDTVMATGYGLTVSPMNQKLIIDPGDSSDASFKISNPVSSTEDTYYTISVEPFYFNEKDEVVFEPWMDSGKIVDWITFNVPTSGKLSPNETKEVTFTINVPSSAPAGGQYASIFVTASNKPDDDEKSRQSNSSNGQQATIKETRRFGHLVYAEITGSTIKQGEITEINVPSFLLSGNITASASIKNTGNVHGTATYTLQVFPLFSSEEVFTNEEKPSTYTILPDRTHLAEIAWDKTPNIGIFNVVFTVEFEGAKEQLSRMVIKCPLWLLFLIVFAIAALIIWITIQAKNHRAKSEK